MFKKFIVTALFCMIGLIVTPAFGDDYITFPEDGVIEVTLLMDPGSDWGIWDTMLYDYTIEDDGTITINGYLDLFCDLNSFGNTMYLTINNGVITNGLPEGNENWNSLVMTSNNLGIAFEFGPDNNIVEWHSHVSLNTDGINHFEIYSDENLGIMPVTRWYSGEASSTGDLIGMIGMSSVPIPGAVWLLGSGLVGMMVIRRRN